MMPELKPCPFCGHDSGMVYSDSYGYAVKCTESKCDVCVLTRHFDTKKEAIEAWNRRAGE